VDQYLEQLAFEKALVEIWQVIRLANQYIEKAAPWLLAKDPEKKERLQTVLFYTTEAIRIVSCLIAPFMPDTAKEMARQMGLSDEPNEAHLQEKCHWGKLSAGRPIAKGKALFPRIQTKKKNADQEKKSANKKTTSPAPIKDLVSIDDFAKLDLRVGVICSAEKIEKAKKLLLLQVDIGTEKRQVIAGIATLYAPEDLIGKEVVVIVNLQPATIMGIESQGMLLAAGGKKVLALATFQETIPPGSTIR